MINGFVLGFLVGFSDYTVPFTFWAFNWMISPILFVLNKWNFTDRADLFIPFNSFRKNFLLFQIKEDLRKLDECCTYDTADNCYKDILEEIKARKVIHKHILTKIKHKSRREK